MRQVHRRRAFTLIELLVVVAIIALLIAICSRAWGGAGPGQELRLSVESAFQRLGAVQLCEPIRRKAAGRRRDGRPALLGHGSHLTDNLMGTNGIIRKTYYCPMNPNQNVDNLWAMDGGAVGSTSTHRVLGYFYLISRGNASITGLKAPKYAKLTTSPQGTTEDQELDHRHHDFGHHEHPVHQHPLQRRRRRKPGTSHLTRTKPTLRTSCSWMGTPMGEDSANCRSGSNPPMSARQIRVRVVLTAAGRGPDRGGVYR